MIAQIKTQTDPSILKEQLKLDILPVIFPNEAEDSSIF
jgi:hypothetical protein